MEIPVELTEQARAMARKELSLSSAFASLPVDEQRDLYRHVVRSNTHKLAREQGLAVAMAGAGAGMGFADYDPGFDGSTEAFSELVESVDFPKFVADLLKAVFDANISVMRAQTDDYIRLMREATKSTADFVKNVKDDDAFAYLAEQKRDQYNVIVEDGKIALTNPEGEKVDPDDAMVKAKIMDAKIQMAKEHRAALREVILMGVTRLVVDKGEVEAGVEFKITAKRKSEKKHQDQNINVANVEAQGGFGMFSAKASMTNTNIQINTANKDAADDLSAKLMGKVNIKFKTDYFKLDNFASMYADGGVAALKPPAGGGGNGAPPAGGAAK
jgi:hypothetical protein